MRVPFYVALLLLPDLCLCLDPLTMGVGAGVALAGSAAIAGWDRIRCQFKECCRHPWVANNVTLFDELARSHVFGQHIAVGVVSRALRSHLRKEAPAKALVLSFHGWTGGGKNYVARWFGSFTLFFSTFWHCLRSHVFPFKIRG